MRNNYFNFNVDKCKICYVQPNGLFDKLLNLIKNNHFTIDCGDFNLRLMDIEDNEVGSGDEVTTTKIHSDIVLTINNEIFTFGALELFKGKYDGFCWITINNKSFYRGYDIGGWVYSWCEVIGEIAYTLQLQYKHITTLEVACDSTRNVFAKTYRLIRNNDNRMILNGKNITDRKQRIANINKPLCRDGIIQVPTLYFEQKKKDAPRLTIYNKTDEIKSNNDEKEYINRWNDFGKLTTYRTEVRIKRNSLMEFWNWYKAVGSPITHDTRVVVDGENGCYVQTPEMWQLLNDPTFLRIVWEYFSNHLLYFRTSNDGKISLADLATT